MNISVLGYDNINGSGLRCLGSLSPGYCGDYCRGGSSNDWGLGGLTKMEYVYTTYGITSDDLLTGSGHIHNYFQKEITRNNLHLYNDIIPVKNWNKVKIILSPKFKCDSKPNLNNCNLNYYIKEAINNIQSNENNLPLIPILRIDTHTQEIVCDSLIPVILPNKDIAIWYNRLNKKL